MDLVIFLLVIYAIWSNHDNQKTITANQAELMKEIEKRLKK